MANFGIFLDVFEFMRFGWFLPFFQKNQVFGYSWFTLLWYRCFYLHRSRDALSPACGSFSENFELLLAQNFKTKVLTAQKSKLLECLTQLSVQSLHNYQFSRYTTISSGATQLSAQSLHNYQPSHYTTISPVSKQLSAQLLPKYQPSFYTTISSVATQLSAQSLQNYQPSL